ncbi:MAG: alpha-hydroxy-acid oxidizing protein [Bauldia sp.]|nr:alpha-hydroxy-acid oxidizing protein [Bauldia sp.]
MNAVNIEDLRQRARHRLPRIFFDYIDGGAFSEGTMRANVADYARYALRQRVLATAAMPDLSTRFLGWPAALPFMLGPIGYLGLYSGKGDLKAAQSANAAGIPFCLSTFSIASLADVRAASDGPLAFQLYMLDDRSISEDLLDITRAVGVETIFVTVDTAVTSVRERDMRNGFRSLTRLTPRLAFSLASKPSWLFDVMRYGMPTARGFDHLPAFGCGALEQATNLSRRIDRTLSWADMEWLRRRWPGRLVIKGILLPEDAQMAQKLGADGIVVSNHGGRQLDGAPSTVRSLPWIRDAVGPDFGVVLDGGVRRGADIVKAIALGADGVSLGRAYAYGLAAAGRAGVDSAINILRKEIEICLALMGVNSIQRLKVLGDRALIRLQDHEAADRVAAEA